VERYAAATDLVPIVEEWVQGRNLAVAAVVRSGRVLAWGAREASSQFPMIGGIAVRRRTIGGDEPGVEAALELLRALEFEGLGDVQYVASHDSGPRLMEVGARPYGWLPLTIAAGADLPHIAVDAMDGVEPDEVVVAKAGLEMLWPGGELRRLASLVRPSTPLPPYSSRVRGLTQAWPPWRRGLLYDGYERDDLRPLFGRFSSGRGSHDAPHRLRHVRRAHEALVNAGQRP
jgi:hypothetical protein